MPRSLTSLIVALLLLAGDLGCRPQAPASDARELLAPAGEENRDDAHEGPHAQSGTTSDPHAAAAATESAPSFPADIGADSTPAVLPIVMLTAAQQESSLVKQGDMFPTLELKNVQGDAVSFSNFCGQWLTVVCFVPAKGFQTDTLLCDLAPDVVLRYRHAGVKAVTIGVQLPADVAKAHAARLTSDVPLLLDTTGREFAKVATRGLPRIFLIDAKQKVIWFDLEYLRSTRRELSQAIRATLKEMEAAEKAGKKETVKNEKTKAGEALLPLPPGEGRGEGKLGWVNKACWRSPSPGSAS